MIRWHILGRIDNIQIGFMRPGCSTAGPGILQTAFLELVAEHLLNLKRRTMGEQFFNRSRHPNAGFREKAGLNHIRPITGLLQLFTKIQPGCRNGDPRFRHTRLQRSKPERVGCAMSL